MELRCPQCGTVYDVSGYAPGHTFACACGQEYRNQMQKNYSPLWQRAREATCTLLQRQGVPPLN